jgi:hypothetical protein
MMDGPEPALVIKVRNNIMSGTKIELVSPSAVNSIGPLQNNASCSFFNHL